jgi:hypothetical protein
MTRDPNTFITSPAARGGTYTGDSISTEWLSSVITLAGTSSTGYVIQTDATQILGFGNWAAVKELWRNAACNLVIESATPNASGTAYFALARYKAGTLPVTPTTRETVLAHEYNVMVPLNNSSSDSKVMLNWKRNDLTELDWQDTSVPTDAFVTYALLAYIDAPAYTVNVRLENKIQFRTNNYSTA